MSTEIRTSIRLPKNIHRTVLELSKKERRSFNAQVVAMIEEYLRTHNVKVYPVESETK